MIRRRTKRDKSSPVMRRKRMRPPSSSESRRERRTKRRQHLREYFRWLKPHRRTVGGLFLIALVAAGLEMIEPLFMRYIVDSVLLNTELDAASRLNRLHLT